MRDRSAGVLFENGNPRESLNLEADRIAPKGRDIPTVGDGEGRPRSLSTAVQKEQPGRVIWDKSEGKCRCLKHP